MFQYMSKYLYFNDFNYGGNECIRDNGVLANTASPSSKRPSIDFQDFLQELMPCACLTNHCSG